jgi:hypothetical protein
MSNFYKSRAIVELEFSHQNTPLQTLSSLLHSLNVPAINLLAIKSVETNFRVHAKPAAEMQPIQVVPADHDYVTNKEVYNKPDPHTRELLGTYAQLMNIHGADSPEAANFVTTYDHNKEFVSLAGTAHFLKKKLEIHQQK